MSDETGRVAVLTLGDGTRLPLKRATLTADPGPALAEVFAPLHRIMSITLQYAGDDPLVWRLLTGRRGPSPLLARHRQRRHK